MDIDSVSAGAAAAPAAATSTAVTLEVEEVDGSVSCARSDKSRLARARARMVPRTAVRPIRCRGMSTHPLPIGEMQSAARTRCQEGHDGRGVERAVPRRGAARATLRWVGERGMTWHRHLGSRRLQTPPTPLIPIGDVDRMREYFERPKPPQPCWSFAPALHDLDAADRLIRQVSGASDRPPRATTVRFLGTAIPGV